MTNSALVTVLTLLATLLHAQQPAGTGPRIDPRGLPGARLIAGGGALPDAIYARFFELAGGAEARVVLIPTASARADTEEGRAATLKRWRDDHPGVHFELLHTRDRATADAEEFCAPLRTATGVWIGGGAQDRLADAYLGTRVERELQALLGRGGVVGGSSAGAAIQSRTMIQEGMDPPVMATGFDHLPGAILDQHFLARHRLPRLERALAMRPGHFGVGIDEGTAILVRSRDVEVLGQSKALFVLPATGDLPQRIDEFVAGQHTDLVTWQRAARERSRGAFPPRVSDAPQPAVPHGALVLHGGGAMPDEVVRRFVALAGGADARVVLVPAAAPRSQRHDDDFEQLLRRHGVAHVETIPNEHPDELTDVQLATIERATAIWFGGGRQWRIVDAFDGTPAVAAFHRVLARGGVIGGTSAGATIQGSLLVRGNPEGNRDMWCEGYQRGFGFLPGVAVDQHFVVRDRTADLQRVVTRAPQIVGLGIDEGTAVVVTGDQLEVVGHGKVAVFDARTAGGGQAVPPRWLAPGELASLATR
ncbi:MAG: cyanophycinase [Planctomycetes bacterium]|nr:cyanophycinase [Planctomycetota bacterium]